MPYQHEADVARSAAHAAAGFIRSRAGSFTRDDARTKALHDLVTDVDEEAQHLILQQIRRAFPDDLILAEEGAEARSQPLASGRRWIVDPLDGTTNFSHGVPPYAVSIAMEENGGVVVGVVIDVTVGETFCATKGGGTTVNNDPVSVAPTRALSDALLATGFPFRDYRYADGYLETFGKLMRGARGLRRHGSAAMDLAWTAAGRFDGYFEAGVAPWDVAAGVLLVQEAGGIVTGLDTGANPVFSGGIIAAGPYIHSVLDGACEPLRKSFGSRETG